MKKPIGLVIFLLYSLIAFSQKKYVPETDSATIAFKWAPTGLVLGSLSLYGEYNFGKQSLTAKIGIPITAHHTLSYDGQDASFNMRATSFLAGYRIYLSEKKHMNGLYFEPYFKYVHHSGEGTGTAVLDSRDVVLTFTNEYNGIGIGAQLGAQFRIKKRFLIDLFFLGPELNSASNHFKATEKTSNLKWSDSEAQDAAKDIQDFIDKFPFVGNNTTIMTDAENRAITADFKGLLPGYRLGVSFGIAL